MSVFFCFLKQNVLHFKVKRGKCEIRQSYACCWLLLQGLMQNGDFHYLLIPTEKQDKTRKQKQHLFKAGIPTLAHLENIQRSRFLDNQAKKDGCRKCLKGKGHERKLISQECAMSIILLFKNLTGLGQRRTFHGTVYYRQACAGHLGAWCSTELDWD